MLIDRLVATQYTALKNFENSIVESKQSVAEVLDVYNYVFALIDHVVRYQKIAFQIPKLNQKSEAYKAFESDLGSLKEVRNQFYAGSNFWYAS